MNLSAILDNYAKEVASWLDQSKKAVSTVQRVQKAVASGNLRDIDRYHAAARAAQTAALQCAESVEPLAFDAAAYLTPDGDFIPELQAAAERAGVNLSVRDGLIFCYPVLVQLVPEMSAVRIEKRLEPNIRPETLVAQLKRMQSREPKSRPERFIEVLFDAYELVQAKRRLDAYIDIPLTQVYQVLTLLPGSDKDYTILDFTRDIYFLDISGITETKRGFAMSLPASTVSRERSTKILKFVTRDGYEKEFAAIKFSPGAA